MKVVVTGAAGKTGRWTVRQLMEAGYEVIASDQVLAEESPAPILSRLTCAITVRPAS